MKKINKSINKLRKTTKIDYLIKQPQNQKKLDKNFKRTRVLINQSKQQQYQGNNQMPKRQSARIMEQSQNSEAQNSGRAASPQRSHSSHTNLHDQAFILYSDDEVLSCSQESSFVLSKGSSKLSKYSSFSSIDNLNQQKRKQNSILGCLSSRQEDSSIPDLHLSQCSDSGISLIKGLGPLFDDKTFLRRSSRIASHEAQSSNQQRPKQLTNTGNIHIQESESQMIEDEKPVSGSALKQQQNSSKIIEENSEQPLNIFRTTFTQVSKLQNPQIDKSYEFNPFSRLTRSSKKLIQEETQSSLSKNQQEESNAESKNQANMSNSEKLAKITKEYLIKGRKEKKIRKMQQKMFNYGLKNYRNQSKSFKK